MRKKTTGTEKKRGNKGKVRGGDTRRGEKVVEKRTEKRQIRRGGVRRMNKKK